MPSAVLKFKPIVLGLDEDFFIPVRPFALTARTEAQMVEDAADMDYCRQRILAALKIPAEYMTTDLCTDPAKSARAFDRMWQLEYADAVQRMRR